MSDQTRRDDGTNRAETQRSLEERSKTEIQKTDYLAERLEQHKRHAETARQEAKNIPNIKLPLLGGSGAATKSLKVVEESNQMVVEQHAMAQEYYKPVVESNLRDLEGLLLETEQYEREERGEGSTKRTGS